MTDAGTEVGCPYCGEPCWIPVDAGGGTEQCFVSDCEVCCRPIHLRILLARDGAIHVSAVTEDDAPCP
jgi:hypothetical protein